MSKKLHILIIDDEAGDYRSFRDRYMHEHDIQLIKDPILGIKQAEIGTKGWDVILVDLDYGTGVDYGLAKVLPGVVKEVKGRCPILVVTTDNKQETRNIAFQLGAQEIVWKGELYDELLIVKIREAIQQVEALLENNQSKTKSKNPTQKHRPDFIAVSPLMQELQARWQNLINYPDSPVLLLGETGVGKEIAARFIHKVKGQPSLPFEAVNLGQFSRELFQSAIFGTVKGAFTGAEQDKIGFFEKAGKGTLFLDEIGEIDDTNQVQLLRVLEERIFHRVGDTEKIDLEAQLIFSTNKDLEEAVEEGTFRRDFFHRISELTFTIPPLRDRPEDIVPLIDHFLDAFCKPHHQMHGKTAKEVFTEAALEKFLTFDWPGNIRELQNTIKRLIFDADGRHYECIDINLLPGRFGISTQNVKMPHQNCKLTSSQISPPNLPTTWSKGKREAYDDLKRIEHALIQEGGHKKEAALRLGLGNDQNLRYRVQKKYFLKYPELFSDFKTVTKAYGLG